MHNVDKTNQLIGKLEGSHTMGSFMGIVAEVLYFILTWIIAQEREKYITKNVREYVEQRKNG